MSSSAVGSSPILPSNTRFVTSSLRNTNLSARLTITEMTRLSSFCKVCNAVDLAGTSCEFMFTRIPSHKIQLTGWKVRVKWFPIIRF